MTDRELATALTQAVAIERLARAHRDAMQDEAAEREAALGVVRKVTELRVLLGRWITDRACRAVVATTTGGRHAGG